MTAPFWILCWCRNWQKDSQFPKRTGMVRSEMAPKRSCAKRLIPKVTIFRDGTLGKRLDHEGSDLINGLIHLWLHNLMAVGR
jgi:hypothetical protein